MPLYEFAWIPYFDDKIFDLKVLAKEEDWSYQNSETEKEFPVLENYVHFTFIRLQEEGKISESPDGTKVCFNTGLVTENYEDIFALFEPHFNPNKPQQKWKFSQFCKESDRALLSITPLPEIPKYFDDPVYLVYDHRLEMRPNWDHLLAEDRRQRYPEPYNSMASSDMLRNFLDGFIQAAVRRVKRNYKTAVPQFYRGKLQLLLPLCMVEPSKASCALVVDREGDVYRANTVLSLDMAYNNARLITRPDADWLQP